MQRMPIPSSGKPRLSLADRQFARPTSRLGFRMVACALLLGCLGAAVPARAQEPVPPAAPAVPSKRFLVLGFYRDATLASDLRDKVVDWILEGQYGVALRPSLPDEDLRCLKTSCLESLAARFHDADYIVGGALVSNADKQANEAQLWIFKIHPTAEEKKQRQVNERGYCNQGPEAAPRCNDIMRGILGTVIQRATQKPEERKKVRCPKQNSWTFGRAFLLGASSGLAASGTVGALGVHIESARGNGTVTVNWNNEKGEFQVADKYDVQRDWNEYAAPGWLATGIGLGGVAASFIPSLWETKQEVFKGECEEEAAGRWTTRRGAAAGVFSGLLLPSLLSAVTMSIVGKTQCFDSATPVPGSTVAPARLRTPANFSCSLNRPANASWGFAGAWAAGLTLSLALP